MIILHLLLSLPIFAQQESLEGLLESIQKANSLCSSTASDFCSQSKQINRDGKTDLQKPAEAKGNAVYIQDLQNRKLKVSVIDEADIQSLKADYPSELRIYDSEVCSQRAHIIGDALAKKGIETAKLLVEPESSWFGRKYIIPDNKVKTSNHKLPYWKYHVANIIYVRTKSGELKQYIIDPFMESYPVPREQWEKRLRTNPNSSIGSMQISSRYVLDPDFKYQTEMSYDQKQLDRAYAIMRGEPKIQDSNY